jgi:hypothetical protein
MTRRTGGALAVLAAAALVPGTAVAQTTGAESFYGGLVVSSANGKRKVLGSVIAGSGVFNGIGRIVERPNRAGDPSTSTRDDLVFPEGTVHIFNVNGGMTATVNRRTCVLGVKIKQTTTVQGGTGKFANATGRFTGTGGGTGVAHRKADGSCDKTRLPTVEIDTVSGAGTLTF